VNESPLYRLRALQMIQLRLRGKSLVAIGKEFGVSEQTVRRSLNWAERTGLVESFEDQILQELVPEAMKTIKAAIQGNNVDAALEVFKGVGLLKKHSDKTVTPGAAENLDDYLRNKRAIAGSSTTVTALSPKPEVRLLEGQLTEVGTINSPAVTQTVGLAGREDRAPVQVEGMDQSDLDESETDQFEADL
jgi:hypothetical protein